MTMSGEEFFQTMASGYVEVTPNLQVVWCALRVKQDADLVDIVASHGPQGESFFFRHGNGRDWTWVPRESVREKRPQVDCQVWSVGGCCRGVWPSNAQVAIGVDVKHEFPARPHGLHDPSLPLGPMGWNGSGGNALFLEQDGCRCDFGVRLDGFEVNWGGDGFGHLILALLRHSEIRHQIHQL